MLSRRRFVGYSALSSAMAVYPQLLRAGQAPYDGPLRLAILGSVYKQGSRLQTIADRFLVGYPWEGDWHMPEVKVVSVYVDARDRRLAGRTPDYIRFLSGATPPPPQQRGARASTGAAIEDASGDLSRARAQQFGFRLCNNIPQALRNGGDRLAVDAVLTVVEQDDYPVNHKGQALLPNYDFFQQCAQVFESEGHAVPYFNHGALSFSFSEAQEMVKTAQRLKMPLLGGTSMPVTWRLPDVDLPMGATVEEAVMVGAGSLDFDALEAMQAMLERRRGGETGVKAVQMLEGDDVWEAGRAGRWSHALMSSALSRSDTPMGLTILDGRTQDLAAPGVLPQLVKDPVAYCVEYTDGTKATLLMLNGAIRDFNLSMRVAGHGMVSTQFYMSVPPNETHSACLAGKIEQMYRTKSAPYSVERTLLASGILEALMTSRYRSNERVLTPQLAVKYAAPAESQYARS
jgi:hypothetical protein